MEILFCFSPIVLTVIVLCTCQCFNYVQSMYYQLLISTVSIWTLKIGYCFSALNPLKSLDIVTDRNVFPILLQTVGFLKFPK